MEPIMQIMQPIMETDETESSSSEIQEVEDRDPRFDLVYTNSSSESSRKLPRPGPDISILGGRYQLDSTIIGTGSTSVVKTARHLVTGDRVAIKIINKQELASDTKKDCVKREISIMKMLRHPNIVRIIEVMNTKTWIYIVMELVTGGGKISDQFVSRSEVHLPPDGMGEEPARNYFQQLISAVDYLHSRGITHRDLKVSNLLLGANGVLKVGDFGLSALSSQEIDGKLQTACGTLFYLAPEVLSGLDYEGAKADIWSCGVILFYLVSARYPFRSNNHTRLITVQQILDADPTYPLLLSQSLLRLFEKIFQPDPDRRITMDEIFEDEWFKKDYQPPRFPLDSQNLVAHRGEAGTSAQVPVDMNAFEILNTFFIGHNHIGKLFNEVHDEKETRFISEKPEGEILHGIERVAENMGFDVTIRSHFQINIEGGVRARRKGHLSIATEIFEIVPSLHLHIVEFRKAEGDVLEFQNFCRHITFALQDIIRRTANIADTRASDASPTRQNRRSGWCPDIWGGRLWPRRLRQFRRLNKAD